MTGGHSANGQPSLGQMTGGLSAKWPTISRPSGRGAAPRSDIAWQQGEADVVLAVAPDHERGAQHALAGEAGAEGDRLGGGVLRVGVELETRHVTLGQHPL